MSIIRDARQVEELRSRLDELVASMRDGDEPAPFDAFEAAASVLFDGPSPGTAAVAAAVADLRAAGPALTRVLQVHPAVDGGQAAFAVLDLFDEESQEWAAVRPLYAYNSLMTAVTIVLAEPTVQDPTSLAMQIGFGLDTVSGLFREVLFGVFGGLRDLRKVGIVLPNRLTSFEELYRRTCLGGIANALDGFGRAARATARRVDGPVILSVQPRRGCAGTAVEVRGLGTRRPATARGSAHVRQLLRGRTCGGHGQPGGLVGHPAAHDRPERRRRRLGGPRRLARRHERRRHDAISVVGR